jgi:hypothetical protein
MWGVNCTAIAGNPIYLEWACFSAKTVKRFMPNVRFSVYTNRVSEARECRWVDDVLKAPDYAPVDLQGAMIDGILASRELSYDVTLFTGADTVFCDDVIPVFELMETGNFDLAVTQPRDQRKRRYPLRGVHPGFPYYNDGALFFPWNDATLKFFKDWRGFQWTHKVECADSRKKSARMHPTQPPFNEALYHNSNLRLVFLPKNYNEQFWTGCLYGKVKILHVHGAGARKAWRMGKRLNANWEKPRLFRNREIIG